MPSTTRVTRVSLVTLVTLLVTLLPSTVAHAAPATPTGLRVVSVTDTTVTMAWNTTPGATAYRLWYGVNAGGTKATMHEPGNVTTTTITGLTPGTTHHIDISASDASGRSAYTPRLPVRTAPAMPRGFTVSAAGPTSLSLSWHASPGAASYRVWYGVNADGTKATKHEAGSATTATIGGLTPGTTYHVDVSAADADGHRSAYTARVPVTLPVPGAPPTPTGLTAAEVTSTSATLTWTSAPEAARHRVWHGVNADGTKATLVPVGKETTTTITDLAPGTTHYVDVAAENAAGQRSPYTPKVAVRTAVATPTGFAVSATTPTSVTFTWTRSTGAAGYRLYYGTNADGTKATALNVGDVTTATITGLSPGLTYHVDIAALDTDGSRTLYTDKLPVTTGPGTDGPLGDDYPEHLRAATINAYTTWGFYSRQCTSFVAWRLRSANGVALFDNWYGQPSGMRWGNATDWRAAAQRAGYRVDTTPARGAIAWWNSGHLGWVAQVNPDGTVVLEEYNWNGDGAYHVRTVKATTPTAYLHIKDL